MTLIVVYSTMADERKINPYLRFNEEPIIKLLQKEETAACHGMGTLAITYVHRLD